MCSDWDPSPNHSPPLIFTLIQHSGPSVKTIASTSFQGHTITSRSSAFLHEYTEKRFCQHKAVIEFPRTKEGKRGGRNRESWNGKGELKKEQGVCGVIEVRMHHILEKMQKWKSTLAYVCLEYGRNRRLPAPSDVSDMCEGKKQILASRAISYTVAHVNCMAPALQRLKLLLTTHNTPYNNPLVLPVGQFWRIAVNQIEGRQNIVILLNYAAFETKPLKSTTDCFDLNIPSVIPMSIC